ncbi:MAG: PaaI family thioesterase [Desulfopila sp.]
MDTTPIQDLYQDEFANCYGCGRNNPHGLHLKSRWEGDDCVCRHTPREVYTGGVPGFLYGGMIASLIDCHGAATAAAAKSRESGEPIGRFVTGKLTVNFLKPTPLGVELEIRGRAIEIKNRKVTVDLQLLADSVVCATGQVLMIQI